MFRQSVLLDEGYDLLKPKFIGGVKGAEVFAVDVQYRDDPAILPDRDYYFAAGFAAACNVSGEFFNVRHDNRFGALPCTAANALAEWDSGACHRTLEWSQYKLVSTYPVESCPPELELMV